MASRKQQPLRDNQPPEDGGPPFVEAELVNETQRPAALIVSRDSDAMTAVDVARRYPRQIEKFLPTVKAMALTDRDVADSCFYSLKRKDKDGTYKVIEGPSIRMAEFALVAWGNIRGAARVLGETPDGRFVEAEGMCWDLENNVSSVQTVRRPITTKEGRKFGTDMIAVTANAACSLALRNAVFRVVPMALIKPAYEAARVFAAGPVDELPKRRETVFGKLRSAWKLTDERILGTINRQSIDEVTLEDLKFLIGLGTAIKDGDQSVDEAFPVAAATQQGKLDAFLGKASEAPVDQPKADPPAEREPGADDEE